MLFRWAYLGVSHALALLRLLTISQFGSIDDLVLRAPEGPINGRRPATSVSSGAGPPLR